MKLAQRVKVQWLQIYSVRHHCPPFLLSFPVCTDNAVDPACDLATGCVCQRGYLPPTCCLCDEPDFIMNPDTEQCDGKIQGHIQG